MWDPRKQLWTVVILGNILLHSFVSATPVYAPQFLPGGSGRNIRHLPCVSRRTGETGVCMFAFTCAKANGTHLGTCIDRFYFGSCCKIADEPEIFPQDNTIEDGPSLSRPYATTQGPIESNDIPEYVSRPKPLVEKKPSTTYTTTVTPSVQTTQSIATTLKDSTKTQTKKPAVLETTTQSVRLSTFQTVQNASVESTTISSLQKNITTASDSLKPSSTTGSTSTSQSKPPKPSSSSAEKPTTIAENVTKLPSTLQTFSYVSKSTTKKPIYTSTAHKPTQTATQKPPQPTTTKTVATTTEKIVPATRFPPRNVTTTKPTTQITTRKPPVTVTKRPASPTTRRPSATTKKPISPTKRPVHPTKPSTVATTNTKPTSGSTLGSKPTNRPTFGTTPTGGSSFATKPTLGSTLATKPPAKPTVSTKPVSRPTTGTTFATKPPTFSTTSTTEKTRPTPVKTKPTITTTTVASKPLVLTSEFTTSTNQAVITSTTEQPISNNIITTDRLSTYKPVTTSTTRPKITSTTPRTTVKPAYTGSAATTQKTKPLLTTSGSTLGTVKPKPTENTTKPAKPSTVVLSTSPASAPVTSSTVASVTNETTSLDNEVSAKPAINGSAGNVAQTTYSPGLVTWTSHSDQTTTKSPEVPSSTASQEVQTVSEWTPITSPDGWVIIQTPTTEKPQIQEAPTSKPVEEPTQQPPTSVPPVTQSPTTEYVTKRTTILPLLSTIATVTIDPELPVPMETLNMSDYKQVCGRRLFPESRIVGGDRSTFGKWPWQISLRQWKTSTYLHKCGAALLNENWAITAAHCVENVPPSDLLLRIGEHDLANEEEPYGFQERRVQIVASHPQFDPRTFEYDLALLRFYEPLSPFQPNVLPICLPDDDESYVGRTAYVTGWGRLYDDGPLPSVLQEVAVPVINNTVCEAMYRNAGYIEHIPHIFICAGWRNGGFDSCEGDSGGPMVIQRARDKRWVLAGVISWGIGCAVPNQPGVYTRISEFREWINQILQF